MSPSVVSRRWRLATRLGIAALVWSFGAILAALLAHEYASDSTSPSGGLTLTESTLVQSKGIGALALVAVPLVASVIVLAAMRARRRSDAPWSGRAAWTAIAVLTVGSLLAIGSFGGFMLPVAIMLGLGMRLVPSAAPAPAP